MSYPAGSNTSVAHFTVGPIDYPDTWAASKLPKAPPTGDHLFPRLERTDIGGQLYCFSCSFRPWVDSGQATAAVVTVGGGQQVPAALGADGRWHTSYVLGMGERAQVAAGGVHDGFGEYNGSPSAIVTR